MSKIQWTFREINQPKRYIRKKSSIIYHNPTRSCRFGNHNWKIWFFNTQWLNHSTATAEFLSQRLKMDLHASLRVDLPKTSHWGTYVTHAIEIHIMSTNKNIVVFSSRFWQVRSLKTMGRSLFGWFFSAFGMPPCPLKTFEVSCQCPPVTSVRPAKHARCNGRQPMWSAAWQTG